MSCQDHNITSLPTCVDFHYFHELCIVFDQNFRIFFPMKINLKLIWPKKGLNHILYVFFSSFSDKSKTTTCTLDGRDIWLWSWHDISKINSFTNYHELKKQRMWASKITRCKSSCLLSSKSNKNFHPVFLQIGNYSYFS